MMRQARQTGRRVSRAVSATVICAATALASSGCSQEDVDPPASHLRFTDVTAEAGLDLNTTTFAVAAGDINADGFPDLVLSLHGRLALFVNEKNGTFLNADAIAEFARGDTHGVSLLDLNDDGWPDIFISLGADRGRGLGENQLYLNEEGKRLVRAESFDSLLEDAKGRGRSVCSTDIDGDNVTDLILMNHFSPGRPHRIAIATSGAAQRFTESATGTALARASASAIQAIDLDGNGDTSYLLRHGGFDAGTLYRRTADGSFKDESRKLGLKPDGEIRAIVPFDYDRDGDLDLFVARGAYLPEDVKIMERRVYFRFDAIPDRKRKGFRVPVAGGTVELNIRFEGRARPERLYLGRDRVNPASLPTTVRLSDAVLAGDPGVDPEVDVGGFLWLGDDGQLEFNFVGLDGEVETVAGYIGAEHEPAPALTVFGARPLPHDSNWLFRNDGGRFTDVGLAAGVAGKGLSSDALAADFDNDGNLDLYVVNGGSSFDNSANQLYLNRGDGTFREVAREAGLVGPVEGRGNSAVAFDYDQDGDLDLFLLNGAGAWPNAIGPLKLFRNDTTPQGASLQVDLRGNPGNMLAMGTSLSATFGRGSLYQQRFCGNGRMATNILPFHIGLGTAPQARLDVTWPSGRKVKLEVPAGSKLLLDEREGRNVGVHPQSEAQ